MVSERTHMRLDAALQNMKVIRSNETAAEKKAVRTVISNIDKTLLRLKRAADRCAGCYLTPEMIDALACSIVAQWWAEAAERGDQQTGTEPK